MKLDIKKWKRNLLSLQIKVIRWLRSFTLPGFHGVPIYYVLMNFINGFSKGNLTDRAAGVAFNVFTAIFPAVMVLFTLIPYMPLEGVQAMVEEAIEQLLPHTISARVVDTIDDIMARQHNTLMSVGIIMAFYFSSGAVRAFFRGFDNEVNHIGDMSFVRMQGGALLVTLILVLLLLLSLVLIIVGNDVLPWFFNKIHFYNTFVITLINIGRWLLTVFALLVGIAVLYYYGNPSKNRKFRLFTPGTIMFTLLFIVGTVGFNYYIVNFSNYNALYGSIGGIIIFMLWIYVNCTIVLIGYELDASVIHANERNK